MERKAISKHISIRIKKANKIEHNNTMIIGWNIKCNMPDADGVNPIKISHQ